MSHSIFKRMGHLPPHLPPQKRESTKFRPKVIQKKKKAGFLNIFVYDQHEGVANVDRVVHSSHVSSGDFFKWKFMQLHHT